MLYPEYAKEKLKDHCVQYKIQGTIHPNIPLPDSLFKFHGHGEIKKEGSE
jgi:hypothetical protein